MRFQTEYARAAKGYASAPPTLTTSRCRNVSEVGQHHSPGLDFLSEVKRLHQTCAVTRALPAPRPAAAQIESGRHVEQLQSVFSGGVSQDLSEAADSDPAPYEFICKQWTSEPDRFIINPIHQMPGLNNQPLSSLSNLGDQTTDGWH